MSGRLRGSLGVAPLLAATLLAAGAFGCRTLSQRHEAAGFTFWPTAARFKQAGLNALKDPVTWAPATGAVLFAVDDWDQRLSDWAVDHHPLFGSTDGASDASDRLRDATHAGMALTALLAPPRKVPWGSRLERLIVQEAGNYYVVEELTVYLKEKTDRPRPDRSDKFSFPSGHASDAFSFAGFANRNLDATRLPAGARRGLKIGLTTLAGGAAWARVEAGKHYPSDVLAGAALGNFLAVFINDAFLADLGPQAAPPQVSLVLGRRERSIALTLAF